MWDLPSCEGLLYNCCIGVVNLTFSLENCFSGRNWRGNMIGCENGASTWWNESWVLLNVMWVRVMPLYLVVYKVGLYECPCR
jgi:hypothetical protein